LTAWNELLDRLASFRSSITWAGWVSLERDSEWKIHCRFLV
jgi:hypothetical protein